MGQRVNSHFEKKIGPKNQIIDFTMFQDKPKGLTISQKGFWRELSKSGADDWCKLSLKIASL